MVATTIKHNSSLLSSLHVVYLLLVSVLSVESLKQLPIYYDSSNHLHRDLYYHPEQSERITACVSALKDYIQQSNESRIKLIDVAAESLSTDSAPLAHHEPFSDKELAHARDMLVQAHSDEYVSNIEQRCHSSRQRRIDEGKNPLGFVGYIDDDTYLTTESYDVCLRATAAWIRAVDFVLDNGNGGGDDAFQSTSSMALTRPPGHHATSTLANGFCLFNFAAAAALHALGRSSKVSILDWDVHYGQGVADIVKKHENIRYVSIHQTPAFPYEGETRKVLGEYNNVLTIPILADNTWLCGYKEYFQNVALPFVYDSVEWQPDLVIVCSGYDALASDELASVSLMAKDYGTMTRLLLEHISSNRQKGGPPGLVLGLEGGYQLQVGVAGGNLADAVLETVCALLDDQEDI